MAANDLFNEEYKVDLEIFEGPLDLLLTLIQKNRCDRIFFVIKVSIGLHCGDDGYIPFHRSSAKNQSNFFLHFSP